jgi:hypothetical protein
VDAVYSLPEDLKDRPPPIKEPECPDPGSLSSSVFLRRFGVKVVRRLNANAIFPSTALSSTAAKQSRKRSKERVCGLMIILLLSPSRCFFAALAPKYKQRLQLQITDDAAVHSAAFESAAAI